MYERKIPKDLTCGIAVVMEIIGNKWATCLLFNIHNDIKRPGQLQQYNPNASRQVLTQQLRELESHGIIRRVIYPELPPKVEYYLTDLGETLIPVLKTMSAWGENYRQIKSLPETAGRSLDNDLISRNNLQWPTCFNCESDNNSR
jgi:DNA-binding HxlR family transcriptional regulator